MIVYDPHSLCSFFRTRGSVLPKAFWYALLPGLLAASLRLLHNSQIIDLEQWDLSTEQGVYQGFTFVLGFVSVFRANQSYSRYWSSSRAVRNMGADWYDAAASLIAFANMSDKVEEVKAFTHTVVRLVCMLHAMALEEVVCMTDDVRFPVLDIDGMVKEDLRVLTETQAQGRKVEIVNQWIKAHILQSLQSGLLIVPPPIVTRVFQQLGSGLVHYHEVLQVVIWPFPFPYAQMSSLLLAVHAIYTPLVLAKSTSYTAIAGILTLVSVLCMKAIELIAAELENPFGHDTNDLPTYEMHHEMMQDLIFLTHPSTFRVPRLLPTAITDHDELLQHSRELRAPLTRKKWDNASIPKTFLLKSENMKSTNRNYHMQSWMDQDWPQSSAKVADILGFDKNDINRDPTTSSVTSSVIKPTTESVTISLAAEDLGKLREEVPLEDDSKNQADTKKIEASGEGPDAQKSKDPQWQDFLHVLSDNMQQFFSQQSEQLRSAHDHQLLVLERIMQQATTHTFGKISRENTAMSQSESTRGHTLHSAPGRCTEAEAKVSGLLKI